MAMTWNGPRFVAAIEVFTEAAVAQIADALLVQAKAECPVDTGALRASGHVVETADPNTRHVVFDMPYASPVHYGNGRNTPNPWLARAVMAMRAEADLAFQSVFTAAA